jgi:superfamily II RNA helicase
MVFEWTEKAIDLGLRAAAKTQDRAYDTISEYEKIATANALRAAFNAVMKEMDVAKSAKELDDLRIALSKAYKDRDEAFDRMLEHERNERRLEKEIDDLRRKAQNASRQ